MPNGYHGKILHVDLTSGQLEVEQPDEAVYRRYMGGSALGMYYLLRQSPRGVDPFSPDSPLVLTLSVLTGAPVSGQSRLTSVARSPLTGAVGDSQSGGFFPAEMKFSGFDALVIQGRSAQPVYLWLHNGEAELRPAEHLWGKITGEAEADIRSELGDDKIEVLQVGPAGENRVRFAALMNMSNRANGRTGMGAVMGSKNLKAVAVRGQLRPPLADRAAVIQMARWGAEHFEGSGVEGLGLLGTAEVVRGQNAVGGLVSRNWASGVFDGWEALDGKTMANTILKDRDTCYACTVRCKRVVEIKEGPHPVDPLYGGPEYETLATFGSYCGIDDLAAVAYASQLCNMYGMDTISCGATIAWAMDCFEQGLLSREETDGLELRFGNAEAMLRTVEKIARREGFGDLLAEGSARAAARVGRGSQDLVVAVKGQEMPAHMPQVKRSLALIYAVNPFGADHQSSEHDPSWKSHTERLAEIGVTDPPQPAKALNEEKVRFALKTQYAYSCLDSVNMCQFVFGPAWHLYGMDQLAETVRAVTGWEVTTEELMRLGERRLNLLRAYNAREGIGREADVLPKKMQKALVGGRSDGLVVSPEEVEGAKDIYYAMAGWDVATGTPTRRKLEQLELGWVADLLETAG
ncbi:MAG TPA: aldehyde ferredoxin oxidoreductase family protein [Anaerolineales bacterium]|nr:aldehyde ferredoxin oxidoreductase family protein [Anaerolineales bacterium]